MIHNVIEDKYCSYGCGNKAVMQFKNGKYCCQDSRNKCPAMKKKNADGNEGRVHTEESKAKISKANVGKACIKAKPFVNTTNIKCSYGCGKTAGYVFDNGLYCCSDDWHRCDVKKRENAKRKVEEFKDAERKERHRESVLNSWKDPARLEIQYENLLNKPGFKKRISEQGKLRWKTDHAFVEKLRNSILHKLNANKNEIMLINIFKELDLDYEFVGDWSLWIDGKNPDFINRLNNKVIEFFGLHWHGEEMTGETNDIHAQNRIDHFSKNGYECMVIWESDLQNIEKLKKSIIEFDRDKF